MKYLIRFVAAFFILSLSTHAQGQSEDAASVKSETPETEMLTYDHELLESLRADDSFRYILPPSSRPNFLKMLFTKFFEWLLFVFGNEIVAWAVLIVIVITGIVGLGFAFYGVFGIGKTFPVYHREQHTLDYTVNKENIHEINFKDEIESAAAAQNYKKAVRMSYLFALKMLTDHRMIDWQPAKTNHDYLNEISDEQTREHFGRLGYFFEYVWYGQFTANEVHFRSVTDSLSELKNKLRIDV